MVFCHKCKRYMCLTCIHGFLDYIKHKPSISKTLQQDDASYKSLRLVSGMACCRSFFEVSAGPCCAFTKSFQDYQPPKTTTKPCRPPPFMPTPHTTHTISIDSFQSPVDSDEGSDDGDEVICTSRKEDLASLRQHMNRFSSDEMSSNSLYLYHNLANPCTIDGQLTLKRKPTVILRDVQCKHGRKARKKARKNASVSTTPKCHNIFQGVLVMPMYQIGIQGDSTNDHWYPDHMALATSLADGTPSVGHCVLSHSCSDSANKFMVEHMIARTPLSGESHRIQLHLPSPEDPSKHRLVWVQIIIIPQVLTSKECLEFEKGTNSFSNEYVTKLKMFGQDDIRDDVDYTVIMGDFSRESTTMPYKLLLLRPTSMLSNLHYSSADKSLLAEQMYLVLRGYCGKRGYELRRVCGSSGYITYASDKDIIAVLDEHEGSLPRRLYAVIILRCRERYVLIYRRVNPLPGSPLFASTHYSPPKDGGSFKMPKICSSTFFPLADFTYNKMMAVLLLQQIIFFLEKEGLRSVATGPLECELIKIERAREVYNNHPEETRMHHLIITFNSFNNFSMVGYPSGYHFDHYYNIDSEYIENKILFSIQIIQKSMGRGGHILGNMYVYALLDWGTNARARAAANRAARAL